MSNSAQSTSRSIFLNTTEAQAAMVKLEATAVKLKAAIDSGELSGKKLKDTLTKLNEVNGNIKSVQTQIDGLRPSFVQTQAEVNKLRNELKRMSEDAPGYAEKFKAYQAARLELEKMSSAMRGVTTAQTEMTAGSSLLGKVASSAGLLVGGLFGAFYAGTAIVKGSLESNAKLSDSLAQLKIYMHGSSEDANVLYESLKKLDTRTSIPELLDIATIVAKKGVAKEEITGVTKSLDQLFVVLGKEIGDPHEAVSSLVKLVNVYSEDHHVTADNISNIGAAIQKLTSSGVATGGFLISFAERLAGVRGITGITIQSVLGLGAALEELGQRNESAATAAQKLITQMFLKPELYAKAAGLSIKEFSAVLAKDPVEALIKVAGVLKSTAKAPADLIQEFSSMNITGARVFGVLGDIAGNADYMRKRLNDASKAFGDQTSLVAAFNEKNTTLAATLEKLGKVIANSVVGTGLVNFFTYALKGVTNLITPSKSLADAFYDQGKKVGDLQKNIVPLLQKYDELKRNTILNKDEQVQLKSVITQIAAVMPGAITEFDKYGNAIGISTTRVREFIKAEKDRLGFVNKQAIDDTKAKVQDFEKEIQRVQKQIDQIAKTGTFKKVDDSGNLAGEGVYTRSANQEEIKAVEDQYRRLVSLRDGALNQIKLLNGQTIEDNAKAIKEAGKNGNDIVKTTGEAGVKSLGDIIAEIKKLKKELLSVSDVNQAKVITDKIKELTAERDQLQGKDPKVSKEVKAEAGIVKQLEAFRFELEQIGKQTDEKEIDRIGRKYEELTAKATRYGVDVIDIEKAKNKAIAYLMDEEAKKRKEELDKIQQLSNEETYKAFIEAAVTQGEQQKDVEQKKYADGILNKRQLAEAIRRIDIETYEFEIGIAEKFSGVSKQASTDLVNFKKRQNKIDLADAVATKEHEIELEKRNALASAQVAVLKTTAGSKGRLDAQLHLLEVEYQNEKKNTELTEKEKELIKTKYQQKTVQTTIDFYAGAVNETLSYVKTGLDIISSFDNARVARENAALAKEIKSNDTRRASIKKLENDRVISATEAERRLTAIQVEEDAKKEALSKQQFARAQKLQIAQAVIAGALAITSTLSAAPGALDILSLGAFRAINIAIAVATTAAQIATIAGQKFATGGQVQRLDNGKITAASNIPTQPNGDDVLATVKVGEVILNEDQQRRLGGASTFRAIGVPGFAVGGPVIKPFWQSRPYRTINTGEIVQSMNVVRFAEGGKIGGQPTRSQTDITLIDILQQSLARQEAAAARQEQINLAVIKTIGNLDGTLTEGIEATVSLTQLRKAEAADKRRRDNSEFR